MLGQSSKIIRTALYRAKCLWCQELMGSAGGLFCKSITQDQLDSVINIFLLPIPPRSLKEKINEPHNLLQYSPSLSFQPQFENISNPYQRLEECKDSLSPQFMEAAAELMTLSLTKIEFSAFEAGALAAGCLAAINEHKNLKPGRESKCDCGASQIGEIKQLYLKLLSEIDKIQNPQFQY